MPDTVQVRPSPRQGCGTQVRGMLKRQSLESRTRQSPPSSRGQAPHGTATFPHALNGIDPPTQEPYHL